MHPGLKVGDHGLFWIDGGVDWRYMGAVTRLTATRVWVGANTKPIALERIDKFEPCDPVNSWD